MKHISIFLFQTFCASMNIHSLKSYLSFKGATININALADTHGNLQKTDCAYQTLMKYDAFEQEKAGKTNFLIIGGDWFMSGDKKGYKSAPDKPLMYFQTEMFNKFVGEIKKKFPKVKSLFIPGNHEFDGGAETFKTAANNLNSTILISNLDFKKSPMLQDDIKSGHIVSSAIDFVQDDKKPDVKYPVLNLGVSPVNMSYYKKDLAGINFINNIPIAQRTVTPKHYSRTMGKICSLAKDFKEQYPDGIIILTSHTGVNFAQECANTGCFDVIFNGHEHKKNNEFANGTPIINLSQNFNKIVNVKIKINDNGKKGFYSIKEFEPKQETFEEQSAIGKYYDELFKEDSKQIYTVKCTDSSITELGIDGVRRKNSHLANLVTDILLTQIKEIDPHVDIFALNSSSIRSGFNIGDKPNTSNAEVLNCLAGINTSQSDIYTTDVSGKELIMLIIDNFLFNSFDNEKNPLIQYSGISINKTKMMDDYNKGKTVDKLCKYVTLKSTNKPVNINKTYRIANPLKYFEKSHNPQIRELLSISKPLNANIHNLFSEYFNKHKTIIYTPDERLT